MNRFMLYVNYYDKNGNLIEIYGLNPRLGEEEESHVKLEITNNKQINMEEANV